MNRVLGKPNPAMRPWEFSNSKAGARYVFGMVEVLTGDGARVVNKLKKAAAQRCMSIPNALLLILTDFFRDDDTQPTGE